MQDQTKQISRWFFLFPAIFLAELVLGFNGSLLIIAGVKIRYILFALASLSLLIACIHTFGLKGMAALLRRADLIVAFFFLINLLFMTIVPFFSGGSLPLAFDEGKAFFMLLLYFPVAFLIRGNVLMLEKIKRYLFLLVTVLAALHLFLYVGETFYEGFGDRFFSIFQAIPLTGSEPPLVMLGTNYVRVIYPTSIFLVFGLFLYFDRIVSPRWYDVAAFLTILLALLATMTKGLWLGAAAGCLVFLILTVLRNRKRVVIRNLILSFSAVIILIFASNLTIFNGMIAIRLQNAFATSQTAPEPAQPEVSDEPKAKEDTVSMPSPQGDTLGSDRYHGQDKDYLQNNDKQGAVESNDVKVGQIQDLLAMWLKQPVLGYGYGSFLPQDADHPQPYSYEMFLPSLLKSIGIVGLFCWGIVAFGIITMMWRSCKHNRGTFHCWLSMAAGVIASVQFNPLLLNFCGMFILLFLFIWAGNPHPENSIYQVIRDDQQTAG